MGDKQSDNYQGQYAVNYLNPLKKIWAIGSLKYKIYYCSSLKNLRL
jgi:hypothetical protein